MKTSRILRLAVALPVALVAVLLVCFQGCRHVICDPAHPSPTSRPDGAKPVPEPKPSNQAAINVERSVP